MECIEKSTSNYGVKEYLHYLSKEVLILDYLPSFCDETLKVLSKFSTYLLSLKSDLSNEFWYENPEFDHMCMAGNQFYDELNSYLELSDPNIMFFHVSKLLDYETKQIRKDGLFRTTKLSIQKKIELAYHNGFLEKSQMEYIIERITPDTQNPYELFYCYTKVDFLLADSKTSMRINSHWGGESTSWHLSETSSDQNEQRILQKISALGETYVVILKQRYNKSCSKMNHQSCSKSTIIKLILLEYTANLLNLENINKHYGATCFYNCPDVIDIVELKLLYTL